MPSLKANKIGIKFYNQYVEIYYISKNNEYYIELRRNIPNVINDIIFAYNLHYDASTSLNENEIDTQLMYGAYSGSSMAYDVWFPGGMMLPNLMAVYDDARQKEVSLQLRENFINNDEIFLI